MNIVAKLKAIHRRYVFAKLYKKHNKKISAIEASVNQYLANISRYK